MYYVKEQYRLTDSDRFLLSIFSGYLFGERKSSNILLPYIEIDRSLEPELVKQNPWVESADGERFNLLRKDFFASRNENDGFFDMEKMGCYIPETFSITLYDRAIAANASLLDVNEDLLGALVLIHMLAHYVTQCPKGVLVTPFWKEETRICLALMENNGCDTKFIKMQYHVAAPEYFRKCSEGYLETIAQLLIYFALRYDQEFLELFTKLSDVQSENYRRYRDFVDATLDDFEVAISLARNADYINNLWPEINPKYVVYEDIVPILKKQ
jgi:hypothetical protein